MSLSSWNNTSADPFCEMRTIQRQMDSLFNNFWRSNPSLSTELSTLSDKTPFNTLWNPNVDVCERDNTVFINAELPGLKREDINIDLQNNVLTLSGEKSQEKREDKDKCHRLERCYGNFSRCFHLPEGVDSSTIRASFENGLLSLAVPLPENRKALKRKIDIKQGP